MEQNWLVTSDWSMFLAVVWLALGLTMVASVTILILGRLFGWSLDDEPGVARTKLARKLRLRPDGEQLAAEVAEFLRRETDFKR